MSIWKKEELDRIGEADELEIASLRNDGTLRKYVTIWVVRVGDDLYIRCVNGRSGAWFRGVLTRHEGRIQAGGVTKDVTFIEESDPAVNALVDAAYRRKYGSNPPQYVNPMVSGPSRDSTLKLTPR